MAVSRPRGKKNTTIQDVARAAGVSVSTVSRVLNDKDDVSVDTYQKVQGVIAGLGYTSSLGAKSLRSHRTGVIGLIIPGLDDPFCIEAIKGVHQAIVALDYDLIAFTSGSIKKHSKAEREQHYVSVLNGGLTDGSIVVTPAAGSFSTAAPLVAIDPNNQCPDCLCVIATNEAGALEATEYLISLGHRRIGFIGGRPDLLCSQQRLRGFTAALTLARIPADPDLIIDGDFTRGTGRDCAGRLLSLPDPPTAIFAANDESAIGTIEAARAVGRRVPDDVSVVGFDNIPEGRYFNPALTTVDQSIAKMGYAATEMLIRVIEGEPLDQCVYEVPTRLVVRDSCRAVTGKERRE